jgi:hypothetical protein
LLIRIGIFPRLLNIGYVFGISSILRLMPCAIANREDAADKVSGTGLELV